MKNYWLMKSEPDCFSIKDLKNSTNQTSCWDGVRNYQARNYMRNMQIGDKVFFYHSNCQIPGIIGIATVVKEAYPDHTAFDHNNEHYDPKSMMDNPKWFMVDVKFTQEFSDIISLTSLKLHPELQHMQLLKKGNRLSVLPVNKHEWDFILSLAKH